MENKNTPKENNSYYKNSLSQEDREMEQLFRERDAKIVAEEFSKANLPEYNSLEWKVEQRRKHTEAKEKSLRATATKKKNRKKKNKLLRKGFIAGALTTVLLVAGLKITNNIIDRIEYNAAIGEAVEIAKTAAEEELIENNLGTRNDKGEFILGDNSVSDYDRLDLTGASPAIIRAYDEAMNNSDEFNDLLNSIGFTGEQNFYAFNGYFNPESGKESRSVYITYTDMDLVEALNQGNISTLINGDESQTQGRGH